MGFSGIAAHNQNQVGVLDVDPVVGHCATAVRGGQTGHRRAVSDPGLIIEGQHAQRTDHLVGQVTRFAARSRGCQESCREPAINVAPASFLETKLASRSAPHKARDAVDGLIPRDAFPFVGSGFPYFRVPEPTWTVDEIE